MTSFSMFSVRARLRLRVSEASEALRNFLMSDLNLCTYTGAIILNLIESTKIVRGDKVRHTLAVRQKAEEFES